MTLATEREALVASARDSIARGSRSFRTASRLFDRETREKAWLLYAWCRACDDLADGQDHGGAGLGSPGAEGFDRLARQTERAIADEPAGDPPFEGLRVLLAETAIPHRFLRDHLRGCAMDAEGWRPSSEADLLAYCYHVAGVVGCMMAVVMGVAPDDEDTLDRACDLGIAFQLANIARDIGEDAAMGRCYIPADWLAGEGVGNDITGEETRPALAAIAGRLAALAERHRASARVGAGRLPFRSRWAVLAAARIYGQIARDVAAKGEAAWDRRLVVGPGTKLRHLLGAAEEALSPAPEGGRGGLWTRPR